MEEYRRAWIDGATEGALFAGEGIAGAIGLVELVAAELRLRLGAER